MTEFIPLVFDREQAYYQWRPHDGLKLQQVYGHADKQGVTEELIRLLDDEFTPRQWHNYIYQILISRIDDEKVVNAILENLERSPQKRHGILSRIKEAKHNHARLTDGIEKYRFDDNRTIRSCTYSALMKFAEQDQSLKTKIEPWLVEGLSDTYDYIPQRLTFYLGRMKVKSALPKLVEACKDENRKIRVIAANAVYQITGEPEPAIKIMTRCLNLSLIHI